MNICSRYLRGFTAGDAIMLYGCEVQNC